MRLWMREIDRYRARPASSAVCSWAFLLLLSACASDRMGMPITAGTEPLGKPATRGTTEPPKASPPAPAQSRLEQWDENDSGAADWKRHFYACTILYRYRKYDALFGCLDAFDRTSAALGEKSYMGSRYKLTSPILSGWLRSSAYAELGDQTTALKWAESAWHNLPEEYQKADLPYWNVPHWKFYVVQTTCQELSGGWRRGGSDPRNGRNNPAALDMRGETIAISLEAELALLYHRLGQQDRARDALERLRKWREVWILGKDYSYLRPVADLLSIGPLYAMNDYTKVVAAYERAAAEIERRRSRDEIGKLLQNVSTLFLGELFMQGLEKLFEGGDIREFSVTLEDVANALVYAEALARLGQTVRARTVLDSMLAKPGIAEMGGLYWATLYERGKIAAHDGERDKAIALLRLAVDEIERVRVTIAYEGAKIGFAGDKQEVYAELAGMLAASGQWEEVLRVVERAKARALVDLLAQQRSVSPPADADRNVQELLAIAEKAGIDSQPALGPTAKQTRGAIIAARADLALRAPEVASLVTVQNLPVSDLAARVAPDEILIDYYISGDALYALVVKSGGVEGFKLSAAGLDDEVRAYRKSIVQPFGPDIDGPSRALYDRLIRPLERTLKGSHLTICPHGILHYLPFSALSDGNAYLVDRFALRLLPSATTLAYLKSEIPSKAGRLLALGNPDLGNPAYDLPKAQEEARHVAALYPASRALVRGEATKTAVRKLGSGFSMLHFATHGIFDADTPLESGLLLANESGIDGRLTVTDLYGLTLDAELVTLSACETGLGKVANGDDVIGLTRGFLYAGARSIVASLWEVDDDSTESLMVNFYRNLRDLDKSEALRMAQIETRQRYPHPMFWAAFQLVGRVK